METTTKQPFKVTIRLRSPVVLESEYPIHLDALIAWHVVREAEGAEMEDPWAAGDDLSDFLASEENQNGRVWKASRLIFTPLRERGMLNAIRKSDPETFLADMNAGYYATTRKLSGIDTRSGQYRAYQMLIPYQWMDKVEAWGVGDIEAVREALQSLQHIGKLSRNGFGLIFEITVEADPAGDDKWRLRVLPEGMQGAVGVAYAPAMHCLSAPYWRKTNRVVAMEPVV